MSVSSHTRTRAFSSSWPKTHAVWVMKDPKTELFVLCFNSFYLKYDSLNLISYLLLESCFHAYASFFHAFMLFHMFLFGYFLALLYFVLHIKRIKKN